MTDMHEIEQLTKRYAEAHRELREAVDLMDVMVRQIQRQRLPVIRRRVEAAAAARSELQAAVQAAKPLFDKPRTRSLHGVKFGFQKLPGKVEIADADQTVKLIRKHMPKEFDALVKVTERPIKEALANLTVAELKRIGCSSIDSSDVVVIRPIDSEIDKLVEALLKDAGDAPERQAAEG